VALLSEPLRISRLRPSSAFLPDPVACEAEERHDVVEATGTIFGVAEVPERDELGNVVDHDRGIVAARDESFLDLICEVAHDRRVTGLAGGGHCAKILGENDRFVLRDLKDCAFHVEADDHQARG
jgi:hypothetical protein